MKLYRVCTENKNYNAILNYLDEQFLNGYTIINANGAWQGKREKSLIIEVVQKADTNIQHLVYWLKKYNEQEVVLVQIINIDSWLL